MIASYGGFLGAGKTITALEDCFRLCERDRRVLVTNVALSPQGVADYCAKKKYHWLYRQVFQSRLYRVSDAESILDLSGCVVLLDEAGIFLNSRKMVGGGWRKFEKFFSNLVLSRKAKIHFIWIAQNYEHVDKQVRDLTQNYYHCTKYGGFRVVSQFQTYGYEKFMATPNAKTYLKFVSPFPRLGPYPTDIYPCYDTLDRLDGSAPAAYPTPGGYLRVTPVASRVPPGVDAPRTRTRRSG